MPDYISIYQSGQKVDELLGKAETALQQSNLDAFKKTISDTYSTKKELETTKTELTTSIDTKINEGVNAKLNISTYNSDNEKLTTYITKESGELETAIEELKAKDEELQTAIDSKVSTDTYNGANELLSKWATEIQLEIEDINGRLKKKTIKNAKTNSGGAISTGLTETTAIYLQGKCTVTSMGPNGEETELLFLAPTISNTNHKIYLFAYQQYTAEADGHHDVALLGPGKSLGDLTIYYYDITGLTITEDAAPASISDDDLFDEML